MYIDDYFVYNVDFDAVGMLPMSTTWAKACEGHAPGEEGFRPNIKVAFKLCFICKTIQIKSCGLLSQTA